MCIKYLAEGTHGFIIYVFIDYADQTPKHMNISQYIASNVPSLKEFHEPSTKLQQGMSTLKALSTVMILLQRYVIDKVMF